MSGSIPASPGNETAAQQRQQRLALGGNARVGIGARKDALDGGVDGAADAAEVLVFGQGQVTVVAIVRVQAFQRERQQRQCILGAALLDVRHQRLDKLVVEFQLAARTRQPARRAADHLAVGAHRHRRQREQFALDAFQRGFGLQALVVVGADGDHADHGGIIVLQQVAEERQERLGLLARLGREQRLGLVDRQHDGVRTACVRIARRGVGAGVRQFAQHCPERLATRFHGLANGGPVLRLVRMGEGIAQRGHQPGLAIKRPALGADRRQHGEMTVVAFHARQQPGAHERGLARTRRAQDHHQPRRPGVPEAAYQVEARDDLSVAAEEDAGVASLQRRRPG